MELQCQQDVRKLLQKKGGLKLYKKALAANVVNMLIVSPIACCTILVKVCYIGPFTVVQQLQKTTGVVLIEGLLLYLSHIVMHEVKGFYWM